jgi:hypothetical protein
MLTIRIHIIIFALSLLVKVHVWGLSLTSDTLQFPKSESTLDTSLLPSTFSDTVAYPDQPSKRRIKSENKTDTFFKNIEERAKKKRWLRELHNSMIINTNPKSSDSLTLNTGASKFIEYDGLLINSIRLVKLDPFNVSINDTILREGNIITRTANTLHVKTNDRILENQVFIKPGERINHQTLVNNERLLRDLPFIEDARIEVERLEEDPGAANIIIITKDLWSKAFFLEMKGFNAGKLEIFDKNLFGSGLEIQNNLHWNPEKSDKLGYEAIYKNPNILGTFINSRVYYTNVFETQSYGYSLQRKFFTQNIKYAGGTSAYYLNTIRTIWVPDSGYHEFPVNTRFFDLWAARAIQLKKENITNPGGLNLIIATRVLLENFSQRPETDRYSYYRYHDKTLWLNSIALSKQSYFKSNLIYSFGRTEDIPEGLLANFTFGPEFNEFSNRFYTSISLSKGKYLDNTGYVFTRMALGGFYSGKGNYEQGLFDVRLSMFTKLFSIGSTNFRHFFKVNYLKGFDRFEDEKVYINDPYGIRGFSENNVFGDEKLVFSLESDAFLPVNFIGFRFVGFGFADLALLGDKSAPLFSDNMFTGFGLGFRIRNERLAFPTFQLRFAYYPNLPEMSPADFIRFLGEERFRPEYFNVDAPSLLDFR